MIQPLTENVLESQRLPSAQRSEQTELFNTTPQYTDADALPRAERMKNEIHTRIALMLANLRRSTDATTQKDAQRRSAKGIYIDE